MKNEFVPYDIALDMKELGFDEPCLSMYMDKKLTIIQRTKEELENMMNTPISKLRGTELLLAPLYQQAFRWFREEYNIHSIFEHDSDNYYYVIQGVNDFDFTTVDSSEENGLYLKYQKVQDACLRKLIEIVKEKID
jgi:hypothetical protein